MVVPDTRSPIYLGSVGSTALSGTDTQFRAALLGGPTNSIPAFVPGSRTNTTANGVLTLGNLSLLASPTTGATWVTFRTATAAGLVAVGTDAPRDSGLPYGSTGLFQIVAWNSGFPTWLDAYNAYVAGVPGVAIGASNPILITVTTGPSDPNLPGLVGLESFAIVALPEPSAFEFFAMALGIVTVGYMLTDSGEAPVDQEALSVDRLVARW